MIAKLTEGDRLNLAATANLAPSVHNTQPARWHFAADGTIWILSDRSRHLPVGDPTGQDAALSCGAALEATIRVLSNHGIGVAETDILWSSDAASPVPGLFAMARLSLNDRPDLARTSAGITSRYTYRGRFQPATQAAERLLADWATERGDLTLVAGATGVETLARLNDEASLRFMRNRGFRGELKSWMRLKRSDGRWDRDGMNAEALGISAIEAFGAGIVLGSPAFEVLNAVGMAKALVSERVHTLSSSAIGLFHCPTDESPVVSGQRFYEILLDITRHGFHAWPMAAVADDRETAAEIRQVFAIPDGHRLAGALRFGKAPSGPKPERARLPAGELIVSS